MRTSAALLPLAGLALISFVSAHEHELHQPRHLQLANKGASRLDKLVRRQSLVDAALSVVDPAADTAAAATTEAAPAATTSAAAAVTTSAASVEEEPTSAPAEEEESSSAATTSEAAQVTTSATTQAAVTTTSAAPTTQAQTTTPPASSSSAREPVASASSNVAESQPASISNDVETLTSTSYNPASVHTGTASSSAASSSASSEEDNSSGGSGINKPTLIVIIVVASSIALVAAVWTIIRKTAFSPSRRFEAKLAPINFATGRRDSFADGGADAILAHERSGSVMSGQMSERHAGGGYAASLGRSDSGKGSLRTTGSIRGREGAYSGSIPYNPQPTAYSGPAYYQQPYHGQQQLFSPAQPGYPQEQAFGYSNLQRGASSRTDLSRGTSSARQPATPAGAYDYAAQQRQLAQQGRSQSRGPY